MSPSSPHKITWIIGLILGTLGIIGHFIQVDVISEHSFTMLMAGYIALAVGTTFKGI